MHRYKYRRIFSFIAFILISFVVVAYSQYEIYKAKHIATDSLFGNELKCIDDVSLVCGKVPVINISLESNNLDKEVYVMGEFIQYNPENNNSYPYQFDSSIESIAVKYRGDSSYSLFDKRQYKIEFREDYTSSNRVNRSLLGMDKNDDWVFNGPFIDTSMMHNKLMYSLAKEMFPWSPDSRYFELYINNEYQGLYLAVEYPSGDETRLNLSSFALLNGESPYLVQRNQIGFGDLRVPTFGEVKGLTSYPIILKYPNTRSVTKKQYEYIGEDISSFEEKLYSEEFDAPNSYHHDIDLMSFVDYFIINELAMIKDAGYQSMFMYKDFGGKLTTTVWDFNNAFDHYIYSDVEFTEWAVAGNNWYQQFLKDETFVKIMILRYDELRQSTLSNQHILDLIDANYELIKDAAERNFDIYDYVFRESLVAKKHIDSPDNFDESVEQLRKNIIKRLKFMDEHIQDFYDQWR